jgi:hypothetical protein
MRVSLESGAAEFLGHDRDKHPLGLVPRLDARFRLEVPGQINPGQVLFSVVESNSMAR